MGLGVGVIAAVLAVGPPTPQAAGVESMIPVTDKRGAVVAAGEVKRINRKVAKILAPDPEPVVVAGPVPEVPFDLIGFLADLRMCESTNRYWVVSPAGYMGAYQFDQPTWDSVASRHAPHLVGVRPHLAAPADQDAMAAALYGERGNDPWPNCP